MSLLGIEFVLDVPHFVRFLLLIYPEKRRKRSPGFTILQLLGANPLIPVCSQRSYFCPKIQVFLSRRRNSSRHSGESRNPVSLIFPGPAFSGVTMRSRVPLGAGCLNE